MKQAGATVSDYSLGLKLYCAPSSTNLRLVLVNYLHFTFLIIYFSWKTKSKRIFLLIRRPRPIFGSREATNNVLSHPHLCTCDIKWLFQVQLFILVLFPLLSKVYVTSTVTCFSRDMYPIHTHIKGMASPHYHGDTLDLAVLWYDRIPL